MNDSYRLNGMIQDLNGDDAAKERHRADPEQTYRAYGVTDEERALLDDGSIEAMNRLSVHPNLQMKWIFINAAKSFTGPGPLDFYLERLTSLDHGSGK